MLKSKLQTNTKYQILNTKYSVSRFILVGICVFVLGTWFLPAPQAQAAVPTWTVGFDANTDFEKSLEGFLTRLLGQVSARQESFLQSYDLAKIMKGREDVNKLIFESFSELRSEPLLLEFQKIKKACQITTDTSSRLSPPGSIGSDNTSSGSGKLADLLGGGSGSNGVLDPGLTVGSLKGQCLFYTQVQEYLRTRGLEIVSKPFLPQGDAVIQGGVTDAIKDNIDPLCIYGVRTNDGECITIKLEGRIITNPDDFLFEEPIQKARDFLYCYFGPWRHFPWAATQKESDVMRDNMKDHFLLTIARKLKFTQTAPPAEWYTEARCQIILAGMQCPLGTGSANTVQDSDKFTTANRDVACIARDLMSKPTLERPIEFTRWSMADLQQTVSRAENTPNATYTKISQVVTGIIGDYRQLRNAQYIAGQGIRPEKYLVGYRSYTKDEYDKLVAPWEKGSTIEGEGSVEPTGDWFFYDTENIISPAIILLNKIQAATQAEFNLAQDAFQSVKVPDSPIDDIAYSGPGQCPGEKSPTDPSADLKRLGYSCFEWQNDPSPQGERSWFHYWSTGPKKVDEGFFERDGGRALSAPWEDPNVALPKEYLTGQHPLSVDENPALSGNYFNRWYKDILELHKWHFGAIVQQWFKKPEKSFFTPDR